LAKIAMDYWLLDGRDIIEL